ncbi:MAG: AAA family ATPase [Verrucomicrobiota bacterium]
MELVLFCGIQATGKSSFFKERFSDTHVRINLDMLRTRNREQRMFDLCLELQQPCVIDNTNPAAADRARYIGPARQAEFRVVGYYFESKIASAIERNNLRGDAAIPERGVLATYNKLELPSIDEGFEKLNFVRITDTGFEVSPWLETEVENEV